MQSGSGLVPVHICAVDYNKVFLFFFLSLGWGGKGWFRGELVFTGFPYLRAW